MPQVRVISPPRPVVDTVQYYDESGTLQTGSTITLTSKNGIRFLVTLSSNYSSRINHYSSFQFEYSTDSGTSWNVIDSGNVSPATADSNDVAELSEINYSGGTVDSYIPIHFYAQAVDVRLKITDLVGVVTYVDVATYTVDYFNADALTQQNEEPFDRLITNVIDWNAEITLQNEEKFEVLIYN